MFMPEKKGQQRLHLFVNFGFKRIVPKLHFKTKKAYVQGLAGGAFRGRPYIVAILTQTISQRHFCLFLT